MTGLPGPVTGVRGSLGKEAALPYPHLPQQPNSCHQHLLWALSGAAQPNLDLREAQVWLSFILHAPSECPQAALQIATSLE